MPAAVSYSGAVTAATAVEAKPVTLSGLSVNLNNTTAATSLTVYDNASAASGTILFQKTWAIQAIANTQMYPLPDLTAKNGLTVAVTGTGGTGAISFWVS